MAANIKLGGGLLIYFSLPIFFLLQLNAARFQNSMRPRYWLLNARRKHFNDCYTYQLREYFFLFSFAAMKYLARRSNLLHQSFPCDNGVKACYTVCFES